MSVNNPMNAREALLAEILQDADKLITRVETLKAELPAAVTSATEEAAGKAFLAARLHFEDALRKHTEGISSAGNHAAIQIENRLFKGANKILEQATRTRKRAIIFFMLVFLAMIGSGIIGGMVAIMINSLMHQ